MQLSLNERSAPVIRDRLFPELWYAVEKWALGAAQKNVLVVGCGSGMVESALLKTGWYVTCVDHDPTALVAMQKTLIKREDVAQARFEQIDTRGRFPFEDGSFHFLICMNYLEFCQHTRPVIREIFRCLAPGGRALIATINRRSLWRHPSVLRQLRPTHQGVAPRLMTGGDLKRLVSTQPFYVEYLRGKARYLPWQIPFASLLPKSFMGTIPLVTPGVFLAYLNKSKSTEDTLKVVP